jgi:dihydropyrimidinase
MESFELKNEMLYHNVDYTPYEGRTLNQWQRYTILRGLVVWDRENGDIVGTKGYGKFLERASVPWLEARVKRNGVSRTFR